MEAFLSPTGLLDFITLATLEIILGIDNIVFIAIVIHNLPSNQRTNARVVGIGLAFILRIIMLFGVSWIIKMKKPLFTLFSFDFSGRNILLIIGGIFLILKSTLELVEMFTDEDIFTQYDEVNKPKQKYWKIILQIVFVDIILSFDSIITAVGMTDNLYIIITSILIAMLIMLISSNHISKFISEHSSIKVIALCFIILVGIMLIFNGFELAFPKAYLYVTVLFSITVETINILLEKKEKLFNKVHNNEK